MRTSFWFIGGIAIIAIVAAFAGFSGIKEYRRVTAIDREIAALNDEATKLEHMNAGLEDRIAYFSSDAYKERIAKERLGRKRTDEQVVAITYKNDGKNDTVDSSSGKMVQRESLLIRGWIKRLFGGNFSKE